MIGWVNCLVLFKYNIYLSWAGRVIVSQVSERLLRYSYRGVIHCARPGSRRMSIRQFIESILQEAVFDGGGVAAAGRGRPACKRRQRKTNQTISTSGIIYTLNTANQMIIVVSTCANAPAAPTASCQILPGLHAAAAGVRTAWLGCRLIAIV
jgi:hypothetical protein